MPSDRYTYCLEQCAEFHRTRKTFSGNGVLKHSTALIEFSRIIGARSAIDYGCGKGNQFSAQLAPPFDTGVTLEEALGYTVTKFDPAVPEFSTPPSAPADLVWCVDVLECVPEQDVDWMIGELARMAVKGLFVTVASYPSKKTMPNGENCHVTIRPEAWWRARFDPVVAATDLNLVLLVA